ncbi:inositol oxygenase 2-like [Raphanus sativus]|uniref:Inositol oxygenase 2-like n=1 Tax=Raphanus sativus TaxID=3726 RepID=A0A9W3D6J4_RAPSA|nr:inositol oxygenase 2-like [Raphanus sativus]
MSISRETKILDAIIDEKKMGEANDELDAVEINCLGYGFRDYENAESGGQQGVEDFYKMQHINQTFGFVRKSYLLCFVVSEFNFYS